MSVRSQRYTIRPFVGLSKAEQALESVRLLVEGEAYEEDTVVLDEKTLSSGELKLVLPSAEEVRAHVAETGVPYVDCGLVILATSNTHRASVILFSDYLRVAEYQDEFAIDRSADELVLRDANGFTVTIAIALLHNLQPEPLRPHLAGTWLAKRAFRVVPERDETSFSPQALTDQVREEYGLARGTLDYIYIDEESILQSEPLSEAVLVFVDEETLNLLLQSPREPVAVQMQVSLATLTMSSVLRSIVKALRQQDGLKSISPADLEAYPAIKRFVEHTARVTGLSVTEVLARAEEVDFMRARLGAAFDLRGHTAKALKES